MSAYKICVILIKLSYALYNLFIVLFATAFLSCYINMPQCLVCSVAVAFTCLTDYVSLLTDSEQWMMNPKEQRKRG